MDVIAFRLGSGQDLRKELERCATAAGFESSFILTCVGGLSSAYLRMPGADKYIEVFDELEIVSLVGTISPDGCHVHGTFSNIRGEVIGGHVAEGCIVRLTAEIVLGRRDGLTFSRVFDETTGYAELAVEDELLPD